MADAAELVAQVDEHDLDALLGEARDSTPPVMPPPTTRTRLDCCFGHGVS